jgi:ABC-type multidrug transport system ATPase subunit
MSLEEIISDGRIRIGGHNMSELYSKPSLLRNMIGYCPQIDVIRLHMTVKETIEYLASLKGIQ